jgi:hypothetical protein
LLFLGRQRLLQCPNGLLLRFDLLAELLEVGRGKLLPNRCK